MQTVGVSEVCDRKRGKRESGDICWQEGGDDMNREYTETDAVVSFLIVS